MKHIWFILFVINSLWGQSFFSKIFPYKDYTLVFSENEWIFGPVLINPPTGEKADKLWHLITGWLEFPNLYEMQRPKMPSDLEMISDTFNPYVKARDWETRANPTP